MIGPEFALWGLPRSGTTWAANWLTSGRVLCLHDPEQDHAPQDVEWLNIAGRFGVASSGLWALPGIAERIAARVPVLIVEREPQAVQAAMGRAGLPALPQWAFDRFQALPGRRVPFGALWGDEGAARAAWDYLRPGERFDFLRWRELARVRVEPVLDKLAVCDASRAAIVAEFQREAMR